MSIACPERGFPDERSRYIVYVSRRLRTCQGGTGTDWQVARSCWWANCFRSVGECVQARLGRPPRAWGRVEAHLELGQRVRWRWLELVESSQAARPSWIERSLWFWRNASRPAAWSAASYPHSGGDTVCASVCVRILMNWFCLMTNSWSRVEEEISVVVIMDYTSLMQRGGCCKSY